MRVTAAYGLIYGCTLAAALGLCGCSPSAPSSAPANQTYIPPSSAPPASGLPASSDASTTPASGLTVTPPQSSRAQAAAPAETYGSPAVAGPGAVPGHHHRYTHSSTDGERG